MHNKLDICTLLIAVVSCADASDSTAPYDAGVSGSKAYIGLFADNVVGVLDIEQARIVKTIPVTSPDGLVITPDGKKVYVSSMDSGRVEVIATAGDTLIGSIDVGAKPAGLAITPDGKQLVVAVGGADAALIVDVASDTVTRSVPVRLAHASCITVDGHYAYVGSQVTTAPAIVRVDLTRDVPPVVLPVDKPPRMLACEGARIYFTSVGIDAVEVIDPDTGKLEAPIASGGSPHDIGAVSTGLELVVSQNAGDLEFIDVASATITDKVATGKLAHWIALSADHTTAYVTNEGDDNVAVVDLTRRVVVKTIPVGRAPRKMALRPR